MVCFSVFRLSPVVDWRHTLVYPTHARGQGNIGSPGLREYARPRLLGTWTLRPFSPAGVREYRYNDAVADTIIRACVRARTKYHIGCRASPLSSLSLSLSLSSLLERWSKGLRANTHTHTHTHIYIVNNPVFHSIRFDLIFDISFTLLLSSSTWDSREILREDR